MVVLVKAVGIHRLQLGAVLIRVAQRDYRLTQGYLLTDPLVVVFLLVYH